MSDPYQCKARAERIEAQGHKPGSLALKVTAELRREASTVAVKAERYASGKWDVRTTGDYPHRVGHVCGARRRYLAEVGPESLGYFTTLKAATAAVAEFATHTRN